MERDPTHKFKHISCTLCVCVSYFKCLLSVVQLMCYVSTVHMKTLEMWEFDYLFLNRIRFEVCYITLNMFRTFSFIKYLSYLLAYSFASLVYPQWAYYTLLLLA